MSRGGKKERGPITAAELVAQLKSSPDWAARQAAAEVEQRASRDSYAKGARGVIADLAAKGFAVESIADLEKIGAYETAVPVLVKWLARVENPAVKKDLVRTLSVPWARGAAGALVAEFRQTDDSSLRWAIGNALEVIATDEIADGMITIAIDPSYGQSRQMVVLGLAKLSASVVTDVLIRLLGDEEVVGHAVMALGRLRAVKARSAVAPLSEHPTAWVRKEAKAALKRLDAPPRSGKRLS